jgi:HeH/LEM domain
MKKGDFAMNAVVKYPHSVDFEGKLYVPGEPLPEDMPKKEVDRLLKKNRVEIPAKEEIIAETPEPKDMTVPALKELLDKLEVPYDAKAKKDELVELVMTKTGEPPKSS